MLPDSLALLRRGYSGRPPGRKVPAGASAGGSRLTPGGGQVMPHARRLLGVLGDAPPAISRLKSVPRRVRGPPWPHCDPAASPQAPPTPAEVLPRARRVTKVPSRRRPRNGQGGATRCLRGATAMFAGALTPPTLDAGPERSRQYLCFVHTHRGLQRSRANLPRKAPGAAQFFLLNSWRAACRFTRVHARKAQVVGGEAS